MKAKQAKDRSLVSQMREKGSSHPDHRANGKFSSLFGCMKKSLFVFALLLVSLTGILVSCHHEIEERIYRQYDDPPLRFHPNGKIILSQVMTTKERAWLLSQPISITDPEILAELQFLRDEGEISPELYELAIRHYTNQIDGYGLGYDDFSDAIVLRTDVADRMKKKTSLNPVVLKHRINMPYYSGGTIPLLLVDKNTPGVPDKIRIPEDWQRAITNAVAEWNSLNTSIKFTLGCAGTMTLVPGTVTIFMVDDFQDQKRYAEAELPGNGEPFGRFIRINRRYWPTPTNSAKKFIIAHELGHIVGIHHTDTSEGVAANIACKGRSSYTDPQSVFRSTIPHTQAWTGFSVCDKKLINHYW